LPNNLAANIFLHFKKVLEGFDLVKTVGTSKVVMEPAGVVGIFTPWNSSAGSIAIKVAPAIAAGCTVVIKPSEMSAMQTEVLMDAFHEAGLPPGVINVVTGLGEVVGTELTKSPDIQKIAFTGSTQIGKLVAKNSLDTMKRLTLELGGKSPNIILDDADLSTAIPMAINACYLNNGQACIAASRLIVPEDRLDEVKLLAKAAVEKIKVGDPRDKDVKLGPLASTKQYKRVQEYIKSGIEEGAELVIGGEGHPQGLEGGNFIKPTVFANVTREMRIAKEEIFGPCERFHLSGQQGLRERDRRIFFTKSSSRFVSRAVATSRSPDSSTASAMFRSKPPALPMTNHTLFINSCLSSCTYCVVSDRWSAALNWEGVVPSHVSRYSCSPKIPPSRPIPDCSNLPKRANGS